MVPLWNLQAHKGYAFHWDGLNTDLREVVLSSAIGDGASRDVGRSRHAQLGQHRSGARARACGACRTTSARCRRRPTRFPSTVRSRRRARPSTRRSARRATPPAARGPGRSCRSRKIGTDRHRLDMWTKPSAAAYNAYGEGHAWKFSHFRTTGGLRVGGARGALAASAVPAQRLGADADRSAGAARGAPARFWRGYDVYDPVRVGFVTSGAGAEREATFFTSGLPGNSNAGTSTGRRLPPDAKRALSSS